MDKEKRVICCDKIHLAKARITDDGFIEGEAVLTRPGIFKYITADGKVSRRFRPPEEVTKQSHLDSMKMMPITENHPRERWVDSKNAKKHTVGQTGENIRIADLRPIASIKILDHEAVEKVKNGNLTELSLGYTAVLDHTAGNYKGEPYDCIQRDMICNHLALVKHGRANADNTGEYAQINLCDSAESDDAILDSQIEDININFNNKQQEEVNDMPNMVKITLDGGIQYDAAPEVANALTNKQKELDDAQAAYQKLKNDHDTLQGKHDALTDELEKTKKHNDNIDINALVKTRLKIIDQARAILSDEEVKNLDEMSDLEIKKAVIKAMSSNVNLDEANETYINGRFDACIDLQPDEKEMAEQRKNVGAHMMHKDDVGTSEEARKRYLDNLYGANAEYKKTGGKN